MILSISRSRGILQRMLSLKPIAGDEGGATEKDVMMLHSATCLSVVNVENEEEQTNAEWEKM